jgi:hypothetical protein
MYQAFRDAMTVGYALSEPGLIIDRPMQDDDLFNDVRVQVALSMLNRHGLIAGATGTGKTKTLQLLAGQLSTNGVPVFVADIKGDLTGLAGPGDAATPGESLEPCSAAGSRASLDGFERRGLAASAPSPRAIR